MPNLKILPHDMHVLSEYDIFVKTLSYLENQPEAMYEENNCPKFCIVFGEDLADTYHEKMVFVSQNLMFVVEIEDLMESKRWQKILVVNKGLLE